ncbi:MAG TPA: hypothetical protein VGP16_29030 [Asanoa sp.]|nr:hypothetical protein [Asanoa sp.]
MTDASLRAGPVRVRYTDGDLRHLRIGGTEIVRRIYLAVRDLNWNTLPGELTDQRIDDGGDAFTVTYRRRHTVGDIDFAWAATITGTSGGVVTFEVDGTALAPFDYAKIGLCVHHPIDGFAGEPFEGKSADGAVSGRLPDTIGPQIRLDDGTDLPLFDPVQELSIRHRDGGTVRFAFAGDLWEMEDQRNWTDASYKSASTPASLGYHHVASAGQRIRQSIVVSGTGFAAAAPHAEADSRVSIGAPSGVVMPEVGLGLAEATPSAGTVELLRRLAPAHLRLDLKLAEADWPERLARALDTAAALGTGLELAVFAPPAAPALAALAERLNGAAVRRVLVFSEAEESTAPQTVDQVRAALAPAVGPALFVSGTNVYFNELNRHRLPVGSADGLVWSVNPQIHAFDELSLVENLAAQPETVRTARTFADGAALFVSPVTLRPRFNAVAVTDEAQATDELPPAVDVRQPSQFAAAWTLGSLAALAPAGVAALTYYETVGARGVVAGPEPEYPGRFVAEPDRPYPLYHVLADAIELAGAPLRAVEVGDPLSVAALAADDGTRTVVLLANLSDRERAVRIDGLPAGTPSTRVLDGTDRRDVATRDGDGVALALRPYATLRLEVDRT